MTNIKYTGDYAIFQGNYILTRSIKEIIRTTDGRRSELKYIKREFGSNADFIDSYARNAFMSKQVTSSIIKCANAYNHYGVRNEIINKRMIGSECPRCSSSETWDHVIRCDETKHFCQQFIIDLVNDLMKEKPEQCPYNDLFDLTEDILIYLENGEEEEYTTNQQMIGMRYLFRGFIVKTWKGVNFTEKKYRNLNKIVMHHCVIYYKKCWDHRNKSYHDEAIQRQRVLKWYSKVKEQIDTKEPTQVKLLILRNKIQPEQSRTKAIVQ